MRVQLNKYLRNVPFEYYKYFKSPERMGAKVCNHCHAELLTLWHRPSTSSPYWIDGNWKNAFHFEYKSQEVHVFEQDLKQDYSKMRVWCSYTRNRKGDRIYITEDTPTLTLSPEEAQKLHAFLQNLDFEYRQNKERNDIRFITEVEICPVCNKRMNSPFVDSLTFNSILPPSRDGEITPQDLNSFMAQNDIASSDSFDNIDTVFSLLHYIQSNQNKSIAVQKSKKTLDLLDTPIQAATVPLAVNSIKSSPEELKRYVHTLFELETNIYSICKRLETLYSNQIDAEKDVFRVNCVAEQEIRTKAASDQKDYESQLAELISLQNTHPKTICLNKPAEPRKPNKPTLETPGFFNRKKIRLQNEAREEEYRIAYQKYEAELKEHQRIVTQIQEEELYLRNEEIIRHQEEVLKAKAEEEKVRAKIKQINDEAELQCSVISKYPSPEKASQSMLEEEIVKTEDLLKRTLDCRNQLYSYDIVFGKYRNLVALATFYEYLISGRCTSLEGSNGAYNIFEAECRANQIIGQLTKIIDSLEQIKENQYLIYAQLQRINSIFIPCNLRWIG